jgi:hypothetical protein
MLQKRVSEIALINVDRIPNDRAGFVTLTSSSNGDKIIPAGDARGRRRDQGDFDTGSARRS